MVFVVGLMFQARSLLQQLHPFMTVDPFHHVRRNYCVLLDANQYIVATKCRLLKLVTDLWESLSPVHKTGSGQSRCR
jgi:hypothetical protein